MLSETKKEDLFCEYYARWIMVLRIAYQQLLNDYTEYHERQTTMDFHHQLKGAILDAVDEGLIDRDPTRKAIIKGKGPSVKKIKYLNQFEIGLPQSNWL